MKYRKPIMTRNELMKENNFSRVELENAYRAKGQNFAWKVNPLKKNSTIKFDTEAFEAWRQKEIAKENRMVRREYV